MQSHRAGKSRARRTRRRLTHRLWLFIIYTAQDHVNDCWALYVLFGSLCSVHQSLSFNSAMESGVLCIMFDALDLKGKSVLFWGVDDTYLPKGLRTAGGSDFDSSILPTWRKTATSLRLYSPKIPEPISFLYRWKAEIKVKLRWKTTEEVTMMFVSKETLKCTILTQLDWTRPGHGCYLTDPNTDRTTDLTADCYIYKLMVTLTCPRCLLPSP